MELAPAFHCSLELQELNLGTCELGYFMLKRSCSEFRCMLGS